MNEVNIGVDGRFDRPKRTEKQVFVDHFSLDNPTSQLKFYQKVNTVLNVGQTQIVLEHENDTNLVITRQIVQDSPGLFIIRGAYVLVAFLMSGFLFVFCTQLILSLFLGLLRQSGMASDTEFSFFLFTGILLAIPAFLIGLAHAMTIAVSFTADIWNGNLFMKTILKWDNILIDWMTTTIFLFVPFMCGGIYLYAYDEDWWERTLIVWFTCIFVYYIFFVGCTIFHEIHGCLSLIRYSPKSLEKFDEKTKLLSKQAVVAAILMKTRSTFSGTRTKRYVSSGNDPEPESQWFDELERSDDYPHVSHVGLFSKLTMLLTKCGMYMHLSDPKRLYSVDEVRGYMPFVTNSSWGLEKMYCRDRRTRFIAVVEGNSSLTKTQVLSTFVCLLVGNVITLFLIIALLVWFEFPTLIIAIVCGAYITLCYHNIRNAVGLLKVYSRQFKNENRDVSESKILYEGKECWRITEPTSAFCWIMLFLELVLLFILPLSTLFLLGNTHAGILFIFVSLITFARKNLNSTVAVQEYGTLDGIEKDNTERGDTEQAKDEEWREKHRLAKIVAEISSGKRNDFWFWIIGFFMLLISSILLGAVSGINFGETVDVSYTSKFQFPGGGTLNYASCSLGQEIVPPPESISTSLSDFAYLSTIAYFPPSITERNLNEWFDDAVDEKEIVQNFKFEYEKNTDKSPVSYKFIGFPSTKVGIISIRGTNNLYDALSDLQLWASAVQVQWTRAVMPLGEVFSPILEYLVETVSWFEESSLKEIAYYKETTEFVRYLKGLENLKYEHLILTGHSLGGGLALISGAQTEIPGIALSGPNALISRRTFDPPISKEAIEKYTFNIVPDRDVVPRLDDLSQNYQRINCRAGTNDPVGCHLGHRSLCEILYSCGSNGRPIPCYCANNFNFYRERMEKAESNSGESIDEECPLNK